jgi:hypothetical protein
MLGYVARPGDEVGAKALRRFRNVMIVVWAVLLACAVMVTVRLWPAMVTHVWDEEPLSFGADLFYLLLVSVPLVLIVEALLEVAVAHQTMHQEIRGRNVLRLDGRVRSHRYYRGTNGMVWPVTDDTRYTLQESILELHKGYSNKP